MTSITVEIYQDGQGQYFLSSKLSQQFIGVSNRKVWNRYLRGAGIKREFHQKLHISQEHLKYIYVLRRFVLENQGKCAHKTWVGFFKDGLELEQIAAEKLRANPLENFQIELQEFIKQWQKQQIPEGRESHQT